MELAGPVPDVDFDFEASSPKSDPYLTDFIRLGEQIYRYTPTAPATASNGVSRTEESYQDPDLIIICSWMYAASKHIAKYTNGYRSKYPTSHILLLRQDGRDFFFRSNELQMRNLGPATTVIRTLASAKNEHQKLNVLMHVFSNGGSWTACQLSDAYTKAMSLSSPYMDIKPVLLPISALIFDSTPSLPNPSASHRAISEKLPKQPLWLHNLGSLALWTYITFSRRVGSLLDIEDVTLSIRRRLNDPKGAFMQRGLRRTYIYSQGDLLIPAKDVEMHARESMALIGEEGEERVRLEDFGNTMHVFHMPGDPGRYWGIVETAWRDRLA